MSQTVLRIRQDDPVEGRYPIRLTLRRTGRPDLEGEANILFALSDDDQADIRWYLEDYLLQAASAERVLVEQIERLMVRRGTELYEEVLEGSRSVRRIFDRILDDLPDVRVEIRTGVVEAASIPWELMREPESDSPIALRARSFVRVQSDPALDFVSPPESDDGRVRLLYVVCRPRGTDNVALRAIANRLLNDLGEDRDRFDIIALRPPSYERLQEELQDAKEAGRPYHIVHFDGHGVYDDLTQIALGQMSNLTLGGEQSGKRGYLLFESGDGKNKPRPVSGDQLGQLLRDAGVPVLVLNACQSAMHEATERPQASDSVHDEVRAIGSLAQAVVDQGIPAVLGMRYSVYVVTAAQFVGQLYKSLAKGRGFGQAASEGRKHLFRNPERWVGLQPRPLQDWFVPVIYEAQRLELLPAEREVQLGQIVDLDPVQRDTSLLRYVPAEGFIGRDETLLMLDRVFDQVPVVLLHAYAGQGKTTTAVEFARWYAQTGGLGDQPTVLFTSFESHTDLADILNQAGQIFRPVLEANQIEWLTLDGNQRREVVIQLLRLYPTLWIWDNVEPVAGFPAGTESAWTAEEQADLAGFLKQVKIDRATKAKILLTSRRDEQDWLGNVPRRIKMPPMSIADSAALALSLGQERQLDRAQMAAWRPLLEYCAGNPLTLRVIAGQAMRLGLRDERGIERFVQAVRDGEQRIQDVDEAQGRDKSLGASLDYGFRQAFGEDELPVIALLHLFQGTVDVDALAWMGREGKEHALQEVQGRSKEELAGLLDRAAEIGLLNHLGSTYYAIHPALPWFLGQLFEGHYDGRDGRSGAEAAERAWVEAMGVVGDYHHGQFNEGNREVIGPLALEEANLLVARRLAQRRGWWDPVTSTMQGLRSLYGYQGRGAEWARLVAEIVPDFITAEDEPLPGREEDYSVVMDYRVRLAREQERNLPRAAELQEKCVAFNRQQAAEALALPVDAPLDDVQRYRIRTLGTVVFALGQIQREGGSAECVVSYEEAIPLFQRIQDTAAEAACHFNLGHAYKNLPSIRDLDAAEVAYHRAFDGFVEEDRLNRSIALQQIGVVYHERFVEGREEGKAAEVLLEYLQVAEYHLLEALRLCPVSAIRDRTPMYVVLGNIYAVDQTDEARVQYEKAVQLYEQIGDIYRAGGTRFNIAVMYFNSALQELTPARQRDVLLRAQAYAAAALRDFQHYQDRAADDEAEAQGLLDDIAQALADLPV